MKKMKMSNTTTTKKVYRVVLYTYHFSAELDEFSHMGVDPYQLEKTPLSSYGDKEEAEALLKKLRVKYPEANIGLQSSFAGGCRLAAGAEEALEWGRRTYRVSEMDAYEDVPASPYDDEYDDDEDEDDEDEEDEYEEDEY